MPKVVSDQNPSLKFVITFFAMFVVNAIVIYLANMLVPANVVLGTMSISHTWAVLLSAGMIAWFTMLFFPAVRWWELRQGRDLKPVEMMAAYLVINFAALWLVSRVSEIFGLGVSSWLVVLVLAAILDFVQGMAVMVLDQTIFKKK